jgi:hypothetical protein
VPHARILVFESAGLESSSRDRDAGVHDKKVITLLSVRIGAPKNPESVH